jgi:hypothetical protein
MEMAQRDLLIRDAMLHHSLENLIPAQSEANSQVQYLTSSASSMMSQDPKYPKKFKTLRWPP